MKPITRHARTFALCALAWTLCLAPVNGGAASPPDVETLMRRGDALYQSFDQDPSRLDEAIRSYTQALALDPGRYAILWTLAEMYQTKGQIVPPDRPEEKIAIWEQGATYGKRAIEVNPDGKEGHYYYMANFGAAAQLQGLFDSLWKLRKIKKELDRTYELDPNWPPVLVARAQYLTEMPGILGGSDSEAEALYRRAIDLDPHCSIANYFLAELLVRQGREQEAVPRLKALIECPDPGNRGSWAMVDVPRAESLLREIRGQDGTVSGSEPNRDPAGG